MRYVFSAFLMIFAIALLLFVVTYARFLWHVMNGGIR